MSRRDYNGLTGKECLDLAMLQIRDILSREGRLSQSQVYHNVTLTVEVSLDSYPHEPKVETLAATASVGGPPPEASPKKRVTAKRVKEVPIPDVARDEIEAGAQSAPAETEQAVAE